MNLEEFRRNYSMRRLRFSDLNTDPIAQFQHWLDEIMATDMRDPTAMVLATCDKDGAPNQRYVLLKEFSNKGFIFYTDTGSTKGQEIAVNQSVSLLFPWHIYERQVRIRGIAELLSRDKVDEYFHSRPVASQTAAYTSVQSSVVESREQLEAQFKSNQEKLGDDIPLPQRWGGYLIRPTSFEFWQGGESRLHDRFRFTKSGENWQIQRLQP